MSNHSLLERAFDLAGSGSVSSIERIRRKLVEEGYTYAEVSQLCGKGLAQQLLERVKLAAANASDGTNAGSGVGAPAEPGVIGRKPRRR